MSLRGSLVVEGDGSVSASARIDRAAARRAENRRVVARFVLVETNARSRGIASLRRDRRSRCYVRRLRAAIDSVACTSTDSMPASALTERLLAAAEIGAEGLVKVIQDSAIRGRDLAVTVGILIDKSRCSSGSARAAGRPASPRSADSRAARRAPPVPSKPQQIVEERQLATH